MKQKKKDVQHNCFYEMRPRHYAANILELKNKDEQRKYFKEQVPDNYKQWVLKYLRMWG